MKSNKRFRVDWNLMKSGILVVVLATATFFTVPAIEANIIVLSDNFESADTSGGSVPLLGRVSDTGQVWTNFGLFGAGGDLRIDPTFSASGANNAAGGSTGNRGNSILLGTTISPSNYGSLILDLDFESPGAANTPQFWLSNAGGTANASLNWRADTHALGWEGLGVPGFFVDTDTGVIGPASLVRSLHVAMHIELNAQTVDFRWFDNADPSDPTTSGSSGTFSYAPTYEPDRLHIYRNAANGSSISGFDNIVVAVPEPSAAALLAVGGLILRRRMRG